MVGECDLQLLLTAAEWVPDHQLPVRSQLVYYFGGLAKLLARRAPPFAIKFWSVSSASPQSNHK
jgi:hypothetical protein